MKRNLAVVTLALGAMLSAGCGSTHIGRVINDPGRYHNRNVTVEGTVTQSVGAFVAGVYQVEDSTGKIYVLSNRGVPSKGARVKVAGIFTPGVNVMGKSFGNVIRERDHKVRY